MGVLRLDEVAVQAIVAKLQANWQARINAINAEKADRIVCAAPNPASFFVGRMQQLAIWPAVFVLAGQSAFREQGAHSMTTAIEINLWVVEQGQTGPELAQRLMRQSRCAIEILYDDDPQEAAYVAGSSTVKGPYRIFPKKTMPGMVFQPSGADGWRGSYLIVFTAEQEEL